MSGGGGGGKSEVTRIEPPSYQLPYLQDSLKYAQGLFREGGPEQYQGSTVTPFAPQTEQALGLTQQRATQGSPVIDAAQGFVQRGLNTPITSQFGGATNPYLDQTFERAAQQSRGVLSSEFSRGGRNIDASAPARADMLSGLAAQIYAPAYENERNRQLQDLTSQRSNQMSLLGYASPLAEADYRDLAALRGVGAEVEGLTGRYQDDARARFEYEQQRPQAALDAYIGRISGQMGQTQIAPPQERNRAAGALGGAASGAALGSMFGPWGTAIGALGGGLFGGLF
jgi:hypothetical protein